MSISNLRKSYVVGALNEADVSHDALVQFNTWFKEALEADLLEPNAMTLATADQDAKPSARVVLLKGVTHEGFVFFTNYESRKGQELAANPQAALVFYWDKLERQVRIEGQVVKVSPQESEVYFKSRPHGSQLGAWASQQSRVISGREVVEQKLQELSQRFTEGQVPLPEFWGGYLLRPKVIEFWQGRPNRLHDRLRYTRTAEGWAIERLSP